MYIWYWDGFSDPGITLGTFATAAIGGNNEPGWSNAEFDSLNDEQMRTLDAEQRKGLIWQQQEVMYEETPQIPYVYPRYLQAYNTAKWTGWTRVMSGNGPAFWAFDNHDTYLKLKPVAATESGAQRLRLCYRLDSRGRRDRLIAAVVASAAAAARPPGRGLRTERDESRRTAARLRLRGAGGRRPGRARR